jgi:hypothetical protein
LKKGGGVSRLFAGFIALAALASVACETWDCEWNNYEANSTYEVKYDDYTRTITTDQDGRATVSDVPDGVDCTKLVITKVETETDQMLDEPQV